MHFHTIIWTLTIVSFSSVLGRPTNCTKVPWQGVNLPGLAWDASILGSAYSQFESSNCNASYEVYPFVDPPSHFHDWHELGFNLFRLPLAWQHAQVDLGGELNETTMAAVDGLVDTITSNNSRAILDIHNYARWYCAVIDQPDISLPNPTVKVTNDHFNDLWIRLADRYKNNDNVYFQLMNEPHDLNITKWASTLNSVIAAIRSTGATNTILVSGTQFARLTNWPLSSAPGIAPGHIQDPLNATIWDFHQYFDDDGGAYGLCEPWSVFEPSFVEVTKTLRAAGAKGMLTEFGGGAFPQCVDLFSKLLTFLDRNADVWEGWTAWGSYNPGSDYLSLNQSEPSYKLVEVMKSHTKGN